MPVLGTVKNPLEAGLRPGWLSARPLWAHCERPCGLCPSPVPQPAPLPDGCSVAYAKGSARGTHTEPAHSLGHTPPDLSPLLILSATGRWLASARSRGQCCPCKYWELAGSWARLLTTQLQLHMLTRKVRPRQGGGVPWSPQIRHAAELSAIPI